VIPNPENSFEELQNEIAAKLQSVAPFSGIKFPDGSQFKVLTEDEGDADFLFTEQIARCGLCVVVESPEGDIDQPDLPGPIINPLEFKVAISEAPIFNRSEAGTKVRLNKAMIAAIGALHGFAPVSLNSSPVFAVRFRKQRQHQETGALVNFRIVTFKAPLAAAEITTTP
jgi:hypothetical protein